jgi:hypothetical protein
MWRVRWRWALLFAVSACGSRTPAGSAQPPEPILVASAPADAAPTLPAPIDAGPDAGPPLDASLAEIGVAACEAVVARFLSCPAMPEDSKLQMSAAARRWREEAATSVEARERLAATCLEIARMSEEMLLKIGC